MGNEQSFEEPSIHPRFSKVQYSTCSDAMLIREPIFSKTKQLDVWIEKRKLLARIYSSPALFLCHNYSLEQSGACSESGVFIGRYEGQFKSTLKEEIRVRSEDGRFFAEEWIWYFILKVSKCASEIYQQGTNHFLGNLHPHNVLINNIGEYKFIVANYSLSMPGLADHFKEYQINGDATAYISPEMLGFLYSTKYADYPNYPKCINRHSAEAFCFGLTLLAMATLTLNISKIYRKYSRGRATAHSRMLNSGISLEGRKTKASTSFSMQSSSGPEYLDTLLESVRSRYSSVLYELIVGLTEENPETRVGIDRTYNILLRPIEHDILTFDKKWIQQLKEQQVLNEIDRLENTSKEICQKWVRSESYVLKEVTK